MRQPIVSSQTEAGMPTVRPEVIAEDEPLSMARRLVVLAPDVNGAEAELARRVWLLASPGALDVLYLSLAGDAEQELQARRQLATLASLTRDRRTQVDTAVRLGRDWPRAIRSVHGSGDLILCTPACQVDDQALAATLRAPVVVLSGPNAAPPADYRPGRRRFLGTVLAVAIVTGFTLLQLRIAQLPQDWAYYALMSLSVLAEAGVVWLWARISN